MGVVKKKICMLGGFAVGKTSLVQRFVRSVFSERYLTTVGVRIDQKSMTIGDQNVELILWDIHGDDEFQNVRAMYLKGMSGYFLVTDGTRRSTLEKAEELQKLAVATVGDVPFFLIVNKEDLAPEWEITESDLERLRQQGWSVLITSAKNDHGVGEAFGELTARMLATT
ncbi:MAG: GTP-binding protein [Verrucomicrobia bacterium]|jgi:small GTP-binding protein|nr:GTP-binding protein [Verrucomicrobiota bacterium]